MFEQDIERLLTCNSATASVFRGLCALDEVKPLTEPAIVVNTDRRKQAGTHWALYMNTDKRIYFDSFWLPPIERELQSLAVDKYNDKCLQSQCSVICGMYCCLMACLIAKGNSLKSCASLFTDDLVTNDLRVINAVEAEFIA